MDESVQKGNLRNFLKVRMAIVEVGIGETNEEAWLRHLTTHPEDYNINVRIFNCQKACTKPGDLEIKASEKITKGY